MKRLCDRWACRLGRQLWLVGILGIATPTAVPAGQSEPALDVHVRDTCPAPLPGDVTWDGIVNSADIIFMVKIGFTLDPGPDYCWAHADVNCTGQMTSADVIWLVNYLFKNGPPPCDICSELPPELWLPCP